MVSNIYYRLQILPIGHQLQIQKDNIIYQDYVFQATLRD